jgi:hypothetical protein
METLELKGRNKAVFSDYIKSFAASFVEFLHPKEKRATFSYN